MIISNIISKNAASPLVKKNKKTVPYLNRRQHSLIFQTVNRYLGKKMFTVVNIRIARLSMVDDYHSIMCLA